MPGESTIQDQKTSVPVICQRCGKPFWHETEDWPPPTLCPVCRAETEGMTFAQAVRELFDA